MEGIMAKARSPQYPAIGLKEAIDKVSTVYAKDYQNKTTREVIAKHIGYESLHGKALGVLSALGKYGLLEGRGDENRVSDLAVTIIAHPPGSAERSTALREASTKPELFAEIDSRFNGGKGSDTAIRSYLLTQKFIPGAADLAIRSYRETKQLVETESGGYVAPEDQEQGAHVLSPEANALLNRTMAEIKRPMTMHEKFALDEGDVTLSYPADLSPESYQDMADRIEIVLRALKRRADAEAERRRNGREDE
jgi:hypothetical protein